MNQRQEQLFDLVVNRYISTAEPVGSKFLVDEEGLDWSEATVRNDLRALEEEGLLTHPHTSAGRIPTSKGYRQYITGINWEKAWVSKADTERFTVSRESAREPEQGKRQVAKTLVELTSELVLVTFSLQSFYYTGLSSLFAQPEFKDIGEVTNFSRLFDQFEKCVSAFIDKVTDVPVCYVGGEHPFGDRLGVIAVRFGGKPEQLLLLLGPERMNYKYHVPLVAKAAELMN